MSIQHAELTDAILRSFYKVYNGLGQGFLEKVYENALLIELQKAGLKVETQHPIAVLYDGQIVGEYYADLIVADLVIVELKAAAVLDRAHEAQLLNYLRATDIEVGLLLNFGARPEFKRKVFTNDRKALRAKSEG
jgi:GxxExxY protein